MKNIKTLFAAFFIMFTAILVVSCSDADDTPANDADHTLIVFLPWTGGGNSLLIDFQTNIADMKTAIERGDKPAADRVVVYFAESSAKSRLFELLVENGKCVEKTLKTYTGNNALTASAVARVLGDAKGYAPAREYSMIVGGHGLGWIPTADYLDNTRSVKQRMMLKSQKRPLTRFFGGNASEYMIDIDEFARGIKNAGMTMNYILFDDCYMSNVEVAYELKDVTRYMVASPAEMMNYGMPYERILKHLFGTPDFSAVCDEMVAFYRSYTYKGRLYPYATIAVTDCRELDALATLMRRINSLAENDINSSIESNINSLSETKTNTSGIQVLDGYAPPIFYDLGDYARHLCSDSELSLKFDVQLRKAVPYFNNTEYYFTDLAGFNGEARRITEYSGLTVSDSSTNPLAKSKQVTAWWKATH